MWRGHPNGLNRVLTDDAVLGVDRVNDSGRRSDECSLEAFLREVGIVGDEVSG